MNSDRRIPVVSGGISATPVHSGSGDPVESGGVQHWPAVTLDHAVMAPCPTAKCSVDALDDDATDTESVLTTLPSSQPGLTTGSLLMMMFTCYAAYAEPFPVHIAHDHFDRCYYSAFQEPVSYAEAMRRPDANKWQAAMDEEKAAFFTNGTWETVPVDPSWNLLSSKWVFKIKSDEHGNVTRYRARLVARGFLQREGVDFGDIFSPVVRYSTLRILFALAAHYGMYKRHLDCPKAFTQADLDTPCYMKPPPGMKMKAGQCLKLHKSIYGLKQASRLFHVLVATFLATLGFTESPNDTCVVFLTVGVDMVLIAIYVDDLLLFSTSEALADDITAKLQAKFQCVKLGEITWCLGMHIHTSADRHTISLDLERYVDTIIARYEFDALQPLPTPMLHDIKLTSADCPTTDTERNLMTAYPFRSAVSSLMFAMVVMRADISFAVTSVARFSANPGMSHWLALVRIFQYLKGTSDLKLIYSRIADTPAPLLYGYSDADWATTDLDKRRTCIGYLLMLAGGAILWLTKFWKPCLSTFEGELGGLTEGGKNAIAVRDFMQCIPVSWYQVNKDVPTTILIDASATKQATDNPKHHSRAKHMETFLAWVRHVIKEGFIRTQKVPRDDNLAEFFVKAYTKTMHRIATRQVMGPFQQLQIKHTGGETLKRRIAELDE
jgi:hypothetical protein